jgi:hypothetical protein
MRDHLGGQALLVLTLAAPCLGTSGCGGISSTSHPDGGTSPTPDAGSPDASAPTDASTPDVFTPDASPADGSPATVDAGHCGNGVRDGDETDVDCGGATCRPCAAGAACATSTDCVAGTQCLLALCTAKTPPIDATLVGYWPLDKDVKDYSGNKNDATAFNATPGLGKVGGGYQVTGSGCLLVPHSASLTMVGGDTLTAMAWVNYAGACPVAGQDHAIVLNLENSYELGIACGSNILQDAIQPLATTWAWEGTATTGVNTWQHVAFVWDGANVLHYVNGQPFDTRPLVGQLSDRGSGLGLGCRNVPADGTSTPVGSFFEGILDEIAIYSRALSATEIQTYFNATK